MTEYQKKATALKEQIASAQQELAKIAAEQAAYHAAGSETAAPTSAHPFADRNRYGRIQPGSRISKAELE